MEAMAAGLGPLSLRQVAALDAVARSHSFRLAAEMLHTSPPTLSRLIAGAEAALQVTLFRRGWSGAEPTPRGDIAARYCRLAVAAIAVAAAEVQPPRPGLPPLAGGLRRLHLLAVEAVLDSGSVTAAARRLGRTQPEVSRALSDLSGRFGLALFRRSGGGMAALPAARRLAALTGALRQLMALLPRDLARLDGQLVGRVAVGMLPFSGQDLIPRALARLTDAHPHLTLACIPGSYNTLVEALRRREIDRLVGILRQDACPDGLVEEPLYAEVFTVVARAGHPLQGAPRPIAELADTNWIVAPHGAPVRSHFEALFARAGLAPPTQTSAMHSFATAEQLVMDSNALAMLSYSPAHLARLDPRLVRIDVAGADRAAADARTPIGLTRLAGPDADAAPALFDALLRDMARALGDHSSRAS